MTFIVTHDVICSITAASGHLLRLQRIWTSPHAVQQS